MSPRSDLSVLEVIENMGDLGRRGSPTSLEIEPGGAPGGGVKGVECFVRYPRARVPLLREMETMITTAFLEPINRR